MLLVIPVFYFSLTRALQVKLSESDVMVESDCRRYDGSGADANPEERSDGEGVSVTTNGSGRFWRWLPGK